MPAADPAARDPEPSSASHSDEEENASNADSADPSKASSLNGETSLLIFRRFIKRTEDNGYDASGVVSKECFSHWVATRANPEPKTQMGRTFQRALTAHITGADGRKPFADFEEEAAVLRVVREKRIWPSFIGTSCTIGSKGFRAQGHHEKLRAFADEVRSSSSNTVPALTTSRLVMQPLASSVKRVRTDSSPSAMSAQLPPSTQGPPRTSVAPSYTWLHMGANTDIRFLMPPEGYTFIAASPHLVPTAAAPGQIQQQQAPRPPIGWMMPPSSSMPPMSYPTYMSPTVLYHPVAGMTSSYAPSLALGHQSSPAGPASASR